MGHHSCDTPSPPQPALALKFNGGTAFVYICILSLVYLNTSWAGHFQLFTPLTSVLILLHFYPAASWLLYSSFQHC